MTPRRFLVDPAALVPGEVELPPAEAAHVRKVLRLGPGEAVVLLDGRGRRADAVLSQVSKEGVRARVAAVEDVPMPRPRLVICAGLLKNPAMDLLVVKLTELLADELRPFVTDRSVVRPRDARARRERWLRLAEQALKQCGAPRRPRVQEPAPLAEVLAAAPPGAAKLMLYEEDQGLTLARALEGLAGREEFWLLVGPEGGFAPAEAEAARAAGFTACHLPWSTLRAETASLAACAVVRFA